MSGELSIRDGWCLEGQLAGQLGLGRDACPYQLKRQWAPREAWLEGWGLGKLIREAKAEEQLP